LGKFLLLLLIVFWKVGIVMMNVHNMIAAIMPNVSSRWAIRKLRL